MLQYLENLAKNRKMKYLTINVMPKNKAAKELYKKLCFQKVKTSNDKWEKMEKIIT